MEQFKIDLKTYNEKNHENIKMEDVELLPKDTYFDGDSKSWQVSFNYKYGANKDKISSSIADYGINQKGKIISTTTSF